MGKVDEARQMIGGLGDRSDSAAVYAALGDRDAAFGLLFKAIDKRDAWPIYVKSDPPFESLHSDRRWKELLRRMNLPGD
jgi:hypothetical protein